MLRTRGVLVALLWAQLIPQVGLQADAPEQAAALVVGDTFTIDSRNLGERRRINVYQPPGYAESRDAGVPVHYMPDEGLAEDFLHVADLVQTRWHYERKPEEKHSTIYHPAALKALRAVFDPHRGKGQVMRKGR